MNVCREDEGIGSETSPMPEREDTPPQNVGKGDTNETSVGWKNQASVG